MPRLKKQPSEQEANTATTTKPADMQINGMTGSEFVEMLDRRIGESESHWNGKNFELGTTSKENVKWYYGRQNQGDYDDDNLPQSPDNRILSSALTVKSYTTTRITEPEVYPSSNSIEAKRFAEDFEKALHIKAQKEKVKMKLKFCLDDSFIRRRGYLKARYDAITKNFCKIEFVPAESIIIDHKARPGEEPRYFRHKQEKSAEDLLTMFPDAKETIYQCFGLEDDAPRSKLQEDHDINEDWAFVPSTEGLDLIVCWNYNKVPFGIIQDPNWRYDQSNFWDEHMVPLVFLNVMSDGRSYIDPTSFVEQARAPQKVIDKRSKQISDNAGLGSIGMPVVDAAALADDQDQYLDFEPHTAIVLDVTNAGKNSINDVFTTWKAGSLPPDVYKDKQDAIAAVQNSFGSSAIQQGNQTENNTLGQDELLRDQSMGRQQEIVDAIDLATERLYMIIAQFLLVYGNDEEIFKFVGENSQFDYILMNSSDLDTNAEIHVKSGTSMPIDNIQRRAMADKAAGQGMIDPLTFWEINDEPNAQKYAKRLADYTLNPNGFMQDVDEEVFNRDAYVDIELIKQSTQPPYRENPDKSYFDYLNKFILDGNLNPENPELTMEQKQALGQFIDAQLARGQQMLGMLETQMPTPQDVQAHNMQVDQQNQSNAAAMKAMPPPQPTQAGAAKGV